MNSTYITVTTARDLSTLPNAFVDDPVQVRKNYGKQECCARVSQAPTPQNASEKEIYPPRPLSPSDIYRISSSEEATEFGLGLPNAVATRSDAIFDQDPIDGKSLSGTSIRFSSDSMRVYCQGGL
ncbi:hypothetical protein R1flu_009265 [Riccia fluitans]|uniref:Uncharacterized protein n=1 Tax=Riccia fluitans TaxID=41844 RepID=A0ABD1Z1R4_9MARC